MNAGVLIFAVLFGIAGYGEANRTMNRYGRTPFGWPAIVWGVLCFLSWVIGVILLAIAERIIRNAAAKAPMYGGSYIQPVNAPAGYGPPTRLRHRRPATARRSRIRTAGPRIRASAPPHSGLRRSTRSGTDRQHSNPCHPGRHCNNRCRTEHQRSRLNRLSVSAATSCRTSTHRPSRSGLECRDAALACRHAQELHARQCETGLPLR